MYAFTWKWHINTFWCIYIFIYTLCMWAVCRANYDRLCPEMISSPLWYPAYYLYAQSHATDINTDRWISSHPSLIHELQSIVIHLSLCDIIYLCWSSWPLQVHCSSYRMIIYIHVWKHSMAGFRCSKFSVSFQM